MDPTDPEQVMDAAETIRRYLTQRPDAVETVEGVARWWLLRQRYEDTQALARRALEHLEREGCIERIRSTGGRVMYRMTANH